MRFSRMHAPRTAVGLMVLLAVLAACSAEGGQGSPRRVAPAASSPAGSGQSGDERLPAAMVTFPSGRVFFAELAVTPDEQSRGYMGRSHIDPEEGLLFIYKRPGIRTFWMKNCLVPLDIIWLDADSRVVHIEHETPPCRRDPCPSFGPSVPTYNVLEVAGGVAREEALQPGDRLEVLTDPGTP
jgi:uncharacterized membrane protein (UPF0127 family)